MSSLERGWQWLARWQGPALLIVSVGVLVVVLGTHLRGISLPGAGSAPDSGRGAGGVAPTARIAAQPTFCLPTDTGCLIQSISAQFVAGMQAAFQPIADELLNNPADIVYQTPLLTHPQDAQNQAILALNTFGIGVVDAALACLLLIGGYNVIVGRHLGLPASGLLDVLPRAVLVAAAVHFNLLFAGLFLTFENRLTLEVIHLAGRNMLTNLLAGLLSFHGDTLLSFLLLVVLGVMVIMLFVQMITRLALAPLGLGCLLLPQTLCWGRLWLVIFSSAVLVQFLQVVALGLGGVFLTTLATTSLLHLDQSLTTALLAIGTLGLVLKIPGMLQTWALHPMMETHGRGGDDTERSGSSSGSGSLVGSGEGGEGVASSTGGTGGGSAGAGSAGMAGMEGTIVTEESGSLLLLF